MDEEIDRLVVSVRADTRAFARDVATMRAELDGPFADGLERAGSALERGLTSAIQRGKFGFDEFVELPKNKNSRFKITNLDPKEGKITVVFIKDIKNDHRNVEKRSYDIDDFGTFLYQPELFESRKFGRLK